MSTKPTGLAAFTKKGAAVADEPAAVKPSRKRAQGDTVALTVRIAREDWVRLHNLAMAEGTSLQNLALNGFSKILAEHGMEPITS